MKFFFPENWLIHGVNENWEKSRIADLSRRIDRCLSVFRGKIKRDEKEQKES